MNLPEEIRNKEFSISLRGYNIQEVEDYIEMLLEKYDMLYNEAAALSDRLSQLSAKLEASSAAKSDAEAAIEEAKKEAAKIIADAKKETENIAPSGGHGIADLLKTEAKISAKKEEYRQLCETVSAFKQSVFDLYSAHITSLSQLNVPEQPKAEQVSPAPQKSAERQVEVNTAPAEDKGNDSTKVISIPQRSAENKAEEAPTVELPADKIRALAGMKITEYAEDVSVREKENEQELYASTGIKITREPVGSAGGVKNFAEVRDRLKKAGSNTDNGKNTKHKKFF